MTTIYDDCSKEELLQIVSEMQNDLNQSCNEIELLNKELNGLYKDLEKANTEINRLKMIIDLKDDARIELVKENKELQRKFDDTTNDYKLASYEISVLNKYIDKLTTENKQLKLRNKMLTKIGLNSIYGIHCCKNHCVYADTDSIKETKDNDSNN